MSSPKTETEADGTDPDTASSFAGKLDLSSFTFTSTESHLTQSLPGPAVAPMLINRPKRVHSLSEQSQVSSGTLTISSPPKKKKRKAIPASYAPPSQYAHLNLLPDAIDRGLIVLFVGLNPGIQTAHSGHAYAHPTNMFWKLLHSSGITPRRCRPEEDQDMPALYQLGLTNIVARPSRNGAEISKAEMDAGVETLEEKARKWKPEVMCIVGKSIWESIWRVRHGRGIRKSEFRYGWQRETENMGVIHKTEDEDGWRGAKVFAATSTSGLAATLKPTEKEQIWRELGKWVERRREERQKETE